jgi:hypothetical protein
MHVFEAQKRAFFSRWTEGGYPNPLCPLLYTGPYHRNTKTDFMKTKQGSGFRKEVGLFKHPSGRAGEGNRTPVCSLGSCRSTIELHPHLRFAILDFRSR